MIQEIQEIKELTMQVSHNGDGREHWLNVAFFHEQLADELTELSELLFGDAFSGFECFDAVIDV